VDPILDQYLDGERNEGAFNSKNLALYSYGYQNPLRFNDPTGLCGADQIGVISGGAASCRDMTWGESHPILSSILGDSLALANRKDGLAVNPISGRGLSPREEQDVKIGLVLSPIPAAKAAGAAAAGARTAGSKLLSAGLNGGRDSVFWSGRGTRAVAETMGTTLEKTPIGKMLDKIEALPGVTLPRSVWAAASKTFAENAEGMAKAVLNNPRAKSVWNTVEKPILDAKETVIQIITHHPD
jgi:hypothetical protein